MCSETFPYYQFLKSPHSVIQSHMDVETHNFRIWDLDVKVFLKLQFQDEKISKCTKP